MTRLPGTLHLGVDVARAAGSVASDSVRSLWGGALPDSPEELIRPAVLETLLGRPISGARLPGVDFESSNCRNFLIEVTETDGRVVSMYAKIPARELAPRIFANAVGYWALECTFCTSVAPHVPVRIPEVYAVAQRGSRFVLLLEDIHTIPGARLFINRDTAAGTSLEQARSNLDAFARLHAAFHGWEEVRRDQVLGREHHIYLSDRGRAVTGALNKRAIEQAHRKAPELVDATTTALYRRTVENWDAMLDHWYAGDLTLAHGDSHLANSFTYDAEDGGRAVGFLDFQGVHWSKGIRDVAYFLINSLDIDVLAEAEDDLIDHYLGAMATNGVTLDRDQTRLLYRSFAFQALVVGVVAVGLGGFTERENTVETMLRRQVAAMGRLDYAGVLDEILT
jgi:hypothetical protein